MAEDTIEFELLGIPVYFKIDYFKKIVEKCCVDKEEHANYMLAVGCGFGLGKNPQKNYNNTVNKIRLELLNILLHDCDSILTIQL